MSFVSLFKSTMAIMMTIYHSRIVIMLTYCYVSTGIIMSNVVRTIISILNYQHCDYESYEPL